MDKKKKIFLIFAAVFLLILFFVVWDMSRRTTFPGQKNKPSADTVIQEENK